MSHYKPYPAYKDSGVEWLGEVPEHWELARFDAKSTTHRDSIDADRLTGLRVLHYSIPAVQEFGHGQEEDGSEIDSNKLIINQKQLLVSKLNPHKQTLVVADKSESFLTVASTEFVPLIPVAADLAYITYVWSSAYCQHYLLARCESSTRSHQRVAPPDITRMPWAWPALDEQKAVVSVLDRETARIDALIEKKTRFIELLREKRQALITHAVTKGLDPNVTMKDSGVEWLGEVPEHWGVRSFKHLAGIRYGIGEPPAYKAEGTPLIRATNVDAGCIRSEGLVYVDPADIPDKRIIWLAPGDIIVVRSGAYTGDSAIVQEHHCPAIAGFDMVVSPKCVNPFFLQYALLSRYLKSNQIDLEKMRAAQPHLNAEELGSCFVLLPPPIEQDSIVAFLDQSTKRVDGVISKTLLSIDLLKERRSALITAAVTGQIDLREAV